jgi:hypothetical protein
MSLSRSLPAGDVFRARVILMLAEGRSYAEVQERLQTTAPTVLSCDNCDYRKSRCRSANGAIGQRSVDSYLKLTQVCADAESGRELLDESGISDPNSSVE